MWMYLRDIMPSEKTPDPEVTSCVVGPFKLTKAPEGSPGSRSITERLFIQRQRSHPRRADHEHSVLAEQLELVVDKMLRSRCRAGHDGWVAWSRQGTQQGGGWGFPRLQRRDRGAAHRGLTFFTSTWWVRSAVGPGKSQRCQGLAHKYQPVTKQEKKQILVAWAKKKAARKDNVPTKRPPVLRTGVNTVTTLVENKEAQLEVIAHDVDPISVVVFLPTLCQKVGAPYCVTQGEVSLQCLVHRKTCATSAFTQVNSEDKGALAKLVEAIHTNCKDRYKGIRCHWEGNALGPQSVAHVTKLEKAKTKELAAKLG
ncbi:LOW QUALITY PROTEIN: 60S ribosomal protein L7a-like [Sturnira hondurensis]|uniref:LOW QUALITY PROTEIN: 60S ribosomal protein L7a-like n=1 Tax=Sturnira hondurensis TaxID=192404 RepID=UPI0018794486|nr:LOW QUALITY PROTEIN: 60S ribosomal protein L7a-like [Sturnira hondurensis]